MAIQKMRVQVYERVCTITGRPRKIQYAVNDVGTLFRRFWKDPVVRFAEPRQGCWDKWERSEGVLPESAYKTNQHAIVLRGAQEVAA
jgi:hypothetical protein